MRTLLMAALALLPTVAIARTPAFDPRAWRGEQAGAATRILTLGTAHLAQLGPIDPATLAPLLDRLAAFKPDAITHEGISGEQCDVLKRQEQRYAGAYALYCWGTEEAAKATGLDVAEAMAKVEETLTTWTDSPTPAQRRRLALLFLAANDRQSAQVQWLQLPLSERVERDGVDAALLTLLTRPGTQRNEAYDIAVALAIRLGLQRVYAVDDHTADSIQTLAGPAFEASTRRILLRPPPPVVVEFERRMRTLTSSGAMLSFYRFLNSAKTQRAFVDEEFRHALKDPEPGLYGRRYVARFETRNMRMVANVRAVAANVPGGRVLNIVGASHKPYYDAYLAMMSDVDLVDADQVLR